MSTRQSVCKKGVDVETNTVSFAFANGKTISVHASDVEKVSPELLLHGISQKLGDSYSGAKSADEAQGLFEKALESLKAGTWNMRGEGGVGRSPDVVEALSRIRGKALAEVQAVWDGLDEEQKKQVRAHPEVKKEVAKIRLARETEKAKTAKELPDLGSLF